MSQQTDRQTEENEASNRNHIASLTISQMIMLNLTVLQKLKKFQFDLVITEQDDNKIYAYEYQQENSYLLLVPRSFYFSTKNKCKSFIELLSLCSRTITIPLRGNYYDEFCSLLSSFCLSHRYKKGKSVIKFYLNGQCSISYLDFVTFQAIQFKQKGPKELLSMKKSNGFQFSLTYFKDQVLPSIFQSQQQSIQTILQGQTNLIKQVYKDLICEQRFSLIYDVMKQTGISFKQLQRQIQAMVLSHHITTVADQQYELIINKQLETIIEQQLDRFKYDLLNINQKENQAVYLRVVYQILNRLRQNQFEVNDDKYMLITSKILQSSSIRSRDREESFAEQNRQLKMALDIQSEEIHRLQRQLQKYRERSTEKKKNNLEIVIEEMDQPQPMLRVKSNNSLTKERLSIKDLKQPLQVMNFNTPNNKSSAKLNSTLLKSTQKKPKEGFRKKVIKQKA